MSTLRTNKIISYDSPNISIDSDLIITGSISGTTFYGNGSNLTGVNVNNEFTGNTPSNPIGNLYANGEIHATTFYGDGSNLTGISGTSGGGGVTEVTYSELVDLITGGTLSVGSYYMITNFKTCYDQPDYDFNKNAITTGIYRDDTEIQPIIVFATSSNTISDIAYQPSYPNDKIKYDWTFSTTERTQGIAYGRISERIDEFNNRTDYDHRQIKFKRYRYYEYVLNNPYQGTVQVSDISATEMIVSGTGTNFLSIGVGNKVGFENSGYKIFEVTDIVSDTEMTVTGLTNTNLNAGSKMYPTDWDEYCSYYQNNVQGGSQFEEYYTFDFNDTNINNYIGDFSNLRNWEEWDFLLSNNVFQNRFNNNRFGDACFNNTFFDDCWNNNVGNYFYNNITDDDFDGNVIGSFFRDNRITANFQYNRIGENFQNNYIVQNSFYRNNIMNDFRDNEISGGDFQNNEIGSQFNNNKIKEEFYKNDIGNGFNGNKIYWGANGNLIGNAFNYNNIYCAFYDNVIGEYFADNTLGDILNPSSKQFYENRIGVRFQTNTITNNFYKNDIGPRFYDNSISGNTYTNRIGTQFENNTIYQNFYDNQIFNEFKGNITYQNFYANKTDWGVAANEFSGNCAGNSFGSFFLGNDFFGDVYGNVIKDGFISNTIGDGFVGNNIGSTFANNTIAQNFQVNEIGNFFTNNIIGEGFGFGGFNSQKNYIGDTFQNNTIGEYFYNNRVGNYFQYNTLGDYFQWNIIDTVIESTDFTTLYGNVTAFTYTSSIIGGTDGTYTGIGGTTNDDGVDATFDFEISGGIVIGLTANTQGRRYSIGDTITITSGFTGSINTFSVSSLTVKVYKPADSTYLYANNETQMDYIISNSPLYDTYSTLNLNDVSYSIHTGDNQNNYAMEINGKIIIPSNDTYYFGLSSDDASDAFIDETKVADWYGAHGESGTIPSGNRYPITLSAGTYPVKVRMQENGGGDVVRMFYGFDNINWSSIPNNWFTYIRTGITGSYVAISASGGSGIGVTFDLTVVDDILIDIQLNSGGSGYTIGDSLLILGSSFGGTDVVDDIIVHVDSLIGDIQVTVTGISSNPSVYEPYTCNIFERKGGNKRLSYYDESDVLTITNIYE